MEPGPPLGVGEAYAVDEVSNDQFGEGRNCPAFGGGEGKQMDVATELKRGALVWRMASGRRGKARDQRAIQRQAREAQVSAEPSELRKDSRDCGGAAIAERTKPRSQDGRQGSEL